MSRNAAGPSEAVQVISSSSASGNALVDSLSSTSVDGPRNPLSAMSSKGFSAGEPRDSPANEPGSSPAAESSENFGEPEGPRFGPEGLPLVPRSPPTSFHSGAPLTEAGADETVWMMPLAMHRPGQLVMCFVYSTSSSSSTVTPPSFIDISSSKDGEPFGEQGSPEEPEQSGESAQAAAEEAQPFLALGMAPEDDHPVKVAMEEMQPLPALYAAPKDDPTVVEDTIICTESVHTEVLESFEEYGDTAMSDMRVLLGGFEENTVISMRPPSEVTSSVRPEIPPENFAHQLFESMPSFDTNFDVEGLLAGVCSNFDPGRLCGSSSLLFLGSGYFRCCGLVLWGEPGAQALRCC